MSGCPMAALASARSPQAEVPPRQNSLQMAEEEDTSTLKLKHLSEAIAMLTDPKVTDYLTFKLSTDISTDITISVQ